jgi:hypothetical protein
MQIQKPKKFLAFALGLGILFFSGEISANQLPAALPSDEAFEITRFSKVTTVPKVDDEISVMGSNFGTDKDKLKVVLGDKEYSPEVSYGNELQFKITSAMKSGNILIRKTIELEDETETKIESNTLYLDLREPSIAKIDASKGLLPGRELAISGKNLGDASFWCDTIELKIKNQKDTSAIVEIPEEFLECSVIAKKSGFEFDTRDKIQLSSPVTLSQISFSGDKFKIYGKGFAGYKNNLDQLKLIFADDSRLTDATFVADGEIHFVKNSTLIPASGRASLEFGGDVSPQFEYTAIGNFPKITGVSDLRSLGERVDFQVQFGGSFDDRARVKVFLNGVAVGLVGSTVETSSQPAQNGEAWIQLDDWKSDIFYYKFDESVEPIIEKIKVNKYLNFEVFGKNFGNDDDLLSVTTSVGDLKVDRARENSATLTALTDEEDEDPVDYVAPEGDFTLTVTNKWGTSNSISFTLPAEAGEIFYATPQITEIEASEGIAWGRKIYILGENLLKVVSAKFDDVSVSAKIINKNKIEVTVPSSAALTGKLSVSPTDRSESNMIDYQLLTPGQLTATKFEFPVTPSSALAQNDEWQTLFSFVVQNTQSPFELSLAEFNFAEKGPLPIIDLRLVDSAEQVIEDVEINLSQKNEKIDVLKLQVPVAGGGNVFTVQAKIFRKLENNATFSFKPGNLITPTVDIRRQASEKKSALRLPVLMPNFAVKFPVVIGKIAAAEYADQFVDLLHICRDSDLLIGV